MLEESIARTSAATIPDSRRLQSIDIWRGLAALAVVAMHMRHDAPGGYREHPFFALWFISEYGYLGVSLFVLISGFCIHRTSALASLRTGRQQLNWSGFWKRRFWRLYPTYIAAIILTLGFSQWIYRDPVAVQPLFGWDILTHAVLIHNLTNEFSTGLGNGVFWSLGMEEQLYGLYFFLFLMFRRGCYRTAMLAVTILAVIWRLAVPWMPDIAIAGMPFHLGSWYHWPFFYCLHWTLGAVAVDAYTGNITLPRWCSSFRMSVAWLVPGMIGNRIVIELLANTGLGRNMFAGWDITSPYIVTVQYMSELLLAVAFFILINWSLKLERAGKLSITIQRLFTPIGRISYSLYLVHIPMLMTMEKYFPQPPTTQGWIIRLLTYWPVVLGGAAMFYYLVEKRFLHMGREPNRER